MWKIIILVGTQYTGYSQVLLSHAFLKELALILELLHSMFSSLEPSYFTHVYRRRKSGGGALPFAL